MVGQRSPNKVRQLPGGVGLWIFILSDLLLFGLFFALFAHDLAASPLVFLRARATLSGVVGLINTLLLLTGSWAVVMGARVVREPLYSSRYLFGAALSGALFLILKSIEYIHLIDAGHGLIENGFYTWYFILTGYHALHVAAGIVVLILVAIRRRADDALAEFAGCYWHLVDLLWIGIFSLVYLI